MTIRPVDMQTLLPKIPEVHKVKNIENEIEKSNLTINIHKEQQQQDKNTKQVIEAKKSQGSKIDREGQQKGKQGKKEKRQRDGLSEGEESKQKENKREILTKIDIRI